MHDRRQDRAHGTAAGRPTGAPTPTPRARLRVPSPLSGGVRGAATPVNCLGWAVNYQRNKPAGAGASRTYSRRCVDPDENKKKKHAGTGRAC